LYGRSAAAMVAKLLPTFSELRFSRFRLSRIWLTFSAVALYKANVLSARNDDAAAAY